MERDWIGIHLPVTLAVVTDLTVGACFKKDELDDFLSAFQIYFLEPSLSCSQSIRLLACRRFLQLKQSNDD